MCAETNRKAKKTMARRYQVEHWRMYLIVISLASLKKVPLFLLPHKHINIHNDISVFLMYIIDTCVIYVFIALKIVKVATPMDHRPRRLSM